MPINSPPPMPSSSSKLKKKKKKKLAVLDTNTISSSGSDSWKKLKILEGKDYCGGNLIGGAAAAARDLHLDGDGDYDVPAVSTEEQQECQVVELRLPVDRFKMNKKLWEEKERLLVKRGLSLGLQFQVPIPTFTDSDLATQLERLVKTSRILHLDEKELYFVEDADDGPFSTINELESLYTIWSLVECLKSDAKPQGEKVLQFLQELTSDKINALCPEYPDKETFKEEAEDGKELLKWGKANGMTADKLNITRCSETGKGVEASEDIEIGEIVLEVPDFLIIDENTVKKSETYKTLLGKDISSEEMLLLWCMMERRNPGPKFKVYFELLPHKFYTGLSFGEKAEIEIGATYLGCELQEILTHLSKRFRDLCAKFIIPSEYKLEDYMWARQLLDTNGMRILASDGTSRLCLVPVAGFFNHSFCPHVLRYELRHEMDHTTIIFRASRPCKKGEQCFISYGNLSGCDLVKSYGFLPLGYNLYDVITLDLGKFVDGIDIIQRNDGFSWPTAMLRTIPYSKSRILPTRLVVDLSASLANAIGDNSDDVIKPYVREVLERLLRALVRSGGRYQDVWRCDDDESDSFEAPIIWQSDGTFVIDVDNEIMTKPSHRKQEYEWDMKLVRLYKFVMRSLVISAVISCENTLKKL